MRPPPLAACVVRITTVEIPFVSAANQYRSPMAASLLRLDLMAARIEAAVEIGTVAFPQLEER
jgi:hypothetical protein